uniref:Uncharacterized protein n=1 Tax=Zea mays TaxID=4577 RepID=A0A804PL64_MAIZE
MLVDKSLRQLILRLEQPQSGPAFTCSQRRINYASAHDNETLFDIISVKTLMNLSIDERCRKNNLSTSMIALSQV